MRIAIFLGTAPPAINGGSNVILEHAAGLVSRGHSVTMVTERPVPRADYAWHPVAATPQWLSLEEAAREDFDIVIATWWRSVFLLQHLSARHYVYFVQSIESRFFPSEAPADPASRNIAVVKELCDSTYLFALPVITEAEWIRTYLFEQGNHRPFLARNGIRKEIFTENGPAASPRMPGRLRVLVEGPVEVFYKNVPRSIELCRRAGADEVWLLSSSALTSFPGADRVFSRIALSETPLVYRSCDLLVKLSQVEGMFGPPLEMFHCGGSAVVYDVTGHDEYIRDGENAFVAAAGDEETVLRRIRELRGDAGLLARLTDGARRTAAAWPDWEAATGQFAAALTEIASGPPMSRNYLRRFTRQSFALHDSRQAAAVLGRFLAREKGGGAAAGEWLQVFWHAGAGFSEANSRYLPFAIEKGQSVSFDLAGVGGRVFLRIDPGDGVGAVLLRRISLFYAGKAVCSFGGADGWQSVAAGGSAEIVVAPEGLLLLSMGEDPQILLPPQDLPATGGDAVLCVEVVCHAASLSALLRGRLSDAAAAPGCVGRLSRRLRGIFS